MGQSLKIIKRQVKIMTKDRRLAGSEVRESTFVKRLFETNSRENIDCHLRLPDADDADNEVLEQQLRESFASYLKELFQ